MSKAQDKRFSTTNLEIAAYLLSLGEKIVDQKQDEVGKTRFFFGGEKERLETKALGYTNNEPVKGKQFMDCYKTVRSLAMN